MQSHAQDLAYVLDHKDLICWIDSILSNKYTFVEEKTWDSPPSPAARGFEPKEDEFDYQMLFPAPRFGFEIAGSSNGKNAIVRACLSDFAIDNVIPCSLIVMVQDTVVIGKQLTEIQDLMKEAMQKESRVKLRFRSKKKLKHQFQKQGNIAIRKRFTIGEYRHR